MEHGTFEERAGQALDDLYPGALFLAAGVESLAERILVRAVQRAFQGYHALPATDDLDRWFEETLAREALRVGELGGPHPQTSPRGSSGVEPQDRLLAAAGVVPLRSRVALWLILFRRRSYEEASVVLDVSREELGTHLAYRHILVAAVMGGGGLVGGSQGVALS